MRIQRRETAIMPQATTGDAPIPSGCWVGPRSRAGAPRVLRRPGCGRSRMAQHLRRERDERRGLQSRRRASQSTTKPNTSMSPIARTTGSRNSTAAGHFIEAWGFDVVASGEDDRTPANEEQNITIAASDGTFQLTFAGVDHRPHRLQRRSGDGPRKARRTVITSASATSPSAGGRATRPGAARTSSPSKARWPA